MPPRRAKQPEVHFQFKPEVLAEFESGGRHWPTRRPFETFCRKKKGYKKSFERAYSSLRQGKPVDPLVARAFVEFMEEEMGVTGVTLDMLFERAAPVAEEGVWETTPSILNAFFAKAVGAAHLTISNPLIDAHLASRMVLASYGFHIAAPGEPLEEETCIRRGEKAMEWTVEQLAAWLFKMSSSPAYRRIVMFVAAGKKKIGASVVLPTKEETFNRLMDGELSWKDLTPEDLEPSSRFIFIHSLSDSDHVKGIKLLVKTTAQARTLFMQAAYFTRHVRPLRPVWGTFVAIPKYRDRLLRFGFVETGNVMVGHGFPTVVIRHPKDVPSSTAKSRMNYKVLRLIVELFRTLHIGKWRKEDRMLVKVMDKPD